MQIGPQGDREQPEALPRDSHSGGKEQAMPKNAKAIENQTKHLTKDEREAREAAERDLIPKRENTVLCMPDYVKDDAVAAAYWTNIIRRMNGFAILDDLDTEVLGVYCSMLSRRDAAEKLLAPLETASKQENIPTADLLKLTAQIESLMGKLQGQERIILTYADKLGLTPAGRISLARKRAARAAEEETDDDDLFGD